MTITRDDIDKSTMEYAAHYNMGRAGYGYGFRCVEFSRLMVIDQCYRPSKEWPDGKHTRTYYVDGAEVADLAAAIAALNVPPVLTEDEQRILDFIPREFTDLRELEDELAGVPHPKNAIMPDTPHYRVMHWLDGLRNKGMVELGKRKLADDYKPENTFTHLRWSPTIRRKETA